MMDVKRSHFVLIMVMRMLKESACIPGTILKVNVCMDLKMMMIKLKISSNFVACHVITF